MSRRTVLIAGASGLVGRAALRHFAAAPDWDAIGVSRRVPTGLDSARLYSLDLADPGACSALMEKIGAKVTHLVFTAQYEAPGFANGWFDPTAIDLNLRMLKNLFEPLLEHAPGFQHVSLMQGSKAYGMHDPRFHNRIRMPLRERDPRLEHPNFYFAQQDYLRQRQSEEHWEMTVFRPTVVYGDAAGVNMNAIRPIAVYAALEREKGNRLDYPGKTYDQPFREAVDGDLVAEALDWAATAPDAQGRIFNVTNGDSFTWRFMWDTVAASFGMQSGEHRPISLAKELPQRDAEWAALVDRYSLDAPHTILEHVGENSLLYADWVLGAFEGDAAPFNSTIAIRKAGFQGCVDSEDMFRKWFQRVQDDGVVPRQATVT